MNNTHSIDTRISLLCDYRIESFLPQDWTYRPPRKGLLLLYEMHCEGASRFAEGLSFSSSNIGLIRVSEK